MMRTDIQFRDDMDVHLIRHMMCDESVVQAARVSTKGENDVAESDGSMAGLIDYLMRSRHGSPFEHNALTVFVRAPIFVFREFMRHRVASYNEESGRYKQLEPVFYVPSRSRPLVQIGRPSQYRLVPGSPEQHEEFVLMSKRSAADAYNTYEYALANGVAREVARINLPVNIYSSMYVTMNARALMNFLSLRVHDEAAMFVSTPQREIAMVAEVMELIWANLMPVTHAAFLKHRRVAP